MQQLWVTGNTETANLKFNRSRNPQLYNKLKEAGINVGENLEVNVDVPLKDLFDAEDYPTKEEIASKYECRYIQESLPAQAYVSDIEDPRHGVSESDVVEVQSRTKSDVELATETATRNVSVLLTHLTDCLKND